MNSKSPEAVARQLCNALEQLTGANLAAVWLYGASVFGHPSVDIDVHILLWEQLSANEWESVWNLHERIAKDASLPLEGLDFWYISMKAAGDRSNPVHLAPWTNGLTDNHWPLHRAHGSTCHRQLRALSVRTTSPFCWRQALAMINEPG